MRFKFHTVTLSRGYVTITEAILLSFINVTYVTNQSVCILRALRPLLYWVDWNTESAGYAAARLLNIKRQKLRKIVSPISLVLVLRKESIYEKDDRAAKPSKDLLRLTGCKFVLCFVIYFKVEKLVLDTKQLFYKPIVVFLFDMVLCTGYRTRRVCGKL